MLLNLNYYRLLQSVKRMKLGEGGGVFRLHVAHIFHRVLESNYAKSRPVKEQQLIENIQTEILFYIYIVMWDYICNNNLIAKFTFNSKLKSEYLTRDTFQKMTINP